MTGLGLGPDHELGGPGYVCPWRCVGPRRGVQAMTDCSGHQLMPGRVELDLVDPVATGVVSTQYWLVDVRQPGLLLRVWRTSENAKLMQLALGPPGALAPERAEQRRIVGHVISSEWRYLVQYLMRGVPPVLRHCHRRA